MKDTIKEILMIFFIIVLCFSAGFMLRPFVIEEKSKDISLYLNEIDQYKSLEKTLKNMSKTLIISYGISEWEAKYYSIIFKEFSDKYNIPWVTYPAMIRVESNFRTTLKSPKDAKGISQILESTAESLCKKLNIKYVDGETLWNDVLNLVMGIEYLSDNIIGDSSRVVNDSIIKHGISSYLGGPDYLKRIQDNDKTNTYVREYSTSVWSEYTKLTYIYKGVCSENINN